jgi:hypothetical protein
MSDPGDNNANRHGQGHHDVDDAAIMGCDPMADGTRWEFTHM